MTNLRGPSECGIPRSLRTQASRCGNTFAFGCLDFKVRPGIRQQTRVCTDCPISQKYPQTLAAAKFLSNYTVQLQCLQRALGRRVTEKVIFSALIVGRAGPQTRATCVARSSANHSAIHSLSHSRLPDECLPISPTRSQQCKPHQHV
jgi:hypothetical protein